MPKIIKGSVQFNHDSLDDGKGNLFAGNGDPLGKVNYETGYIELGPKFNKPEIRAKVKYGIKKVKVYGKDKFHINTTTEDLINSINNSLEFLKNYTNSELKPWRVILISAALTMQYVVKKLAVD